MAAGRYNTALIEMLPRVVQNCLNHAIWAFTPTFFIPILIGIPYFLLQSCC